jgi:predicted PurR-regulated permease PerM
MFKKDFIGYGALAGLLGLIIGAKLLSLCLFLLFICLFSDVFTNGIHRRFPKIPVRFLFWMFHLLLGLLFAFITIRIMPLFSADFREYYARIEGDISRLLAALSNRYHIDFNYGFIREKLFSSGSKSIGRIIDLLNGISKGFVYFIFAVVLNFLLFVERKRVAATFTGRPESLQAYLYAFLAHRIGRFYFFFRKVMGGQVIISLINTLITLAVVVALGLPHKVSLLCLVFICGLLPVVGNLISNSIITLTAFFSAGLVPAAVCLALLVGVHKLEYFLNSKIIGDIIRLPMFVTLLSLLLGEAVLGIPGMILAIPFVLTFKEELERIRA